MEILASEERLEVGKSPRDCSFVHSLIRSFIYLFIMCLSGPCVVKGALGGSGDY